MVRKDGYHFRFPQETSLLAERNARRNILTLRH